MLDSKMMVKVKSFNKLWRMMGPYLTFKASLDYLKIKNYSEFIYPDINTRAMVRSRFIDIWKEIENGKFKSFKFLSNIIERGETIFDIGAWIGPYTLFFSFLTGAEGKTVAFEPSKSFYRLLDNVKKNRLSNVIIEKMCVSDTIGTVKIKTNNQCGGESSMIRYEEIAIEKEYENLEVFLSKSTTIDNYCSQHRIVPNGMKIDVEGAEHLVIVGAKDTIRQHHPWALVEFHGFMREEENKKSWNKIIEYAQEITFIQGDDPRYQYQDKIKTKPKGRFLVFIKY